jgi:hypothetical protein
VRRRRRRLIRLGGLFTRQEQPEIPIALTVLKETALKDPWLDRPSARSGDEREQRYQSWLLRTDTADTPERRELYMRRYRKPDPPEL